MARKYRKGRKLSQQQYRARLVKYEEYKSSTLDPKSFKEWNEPYRKNLFFRREWNLYRKRFAARKKSAKYGIRKAADGGEVEEYKFFKFKQQYLITRNSLEAEVEQGERKRIGSVVDEMIQDQIYELSRPKAEAVANYLLREKRQLLKQKGILKTEIGENGKSIDVIKRRNLTLLIRQGQFVAEEVGLWDEIKEIYKWLTTKGGMDSYAARDEIGLTYFESDPKKRGKA